MSQDSDNTPMREYMIQPGFGGGGEVRVCNVLVPQPQADLAMNLMERWGMVACELDGEDTAGRQKLRLMTPDELIARACETAEKAYTAFRARGWMLKIPKADPDDPGFMAELHDVKRKLREIKKGLDKTDGIPPAEE